MAARVGLREAMGVRPARARFRQAMVALRGQEGVPASRYDLTSLRQLRPRLGLPLWRGRFAVPRTVVLTNLFNHAQTPIENGWSVRMRQMRDFRGRTLTYDSHNGTDLAVPIGTPVLTAAPGRVVRIVSAFNRGGLKVFIDHGEGLMTVYAHLARALVQPGEVVGRGRRIALSGYRRAGRVHHLPLGRAARALQHLARRAAGRSVSGRRGAEPVAGRSIAGAPAGVGGRRCGGVVRQRPRRGGRGRDPGGVYGARPPRRARRHGARLGPHRRPGRRAQLYPDPIHRPSLSVCGHAPPSAPSRPAVPRRSRRRRRVPGRSAVRRDR